jgi:hypothetical protein
MSISLSRSLSLSRTATHTQNTHTHTHTLSLSMHTHNPLGDDHLSESIAGIVRGGGSNGLAPSSREGAV